MKYEREVLFDCWMKLEVLKLEQHRSIEMNKEQPRMKLSLFRSENTITFSMIYHKNNLNEIIVL